jgi:hypothetical protein
MALVIAGSIARAVQLLVSMSVSPAGDGDAPSPSTPQSASVSEPSQAAQRPSAVPPAVGGREIVVGETSTTAEDDLGDITRGRNDEQPVALCVDGQRGNSGRQLVELQVVEACLDEEVEAEERRILTRVAEDGEPGRGPFPPHDGRLEELDTRTDAPSVRAGRQVDPDVGEAAFGIPPAGDDDECRPPRPGDLPRIHVVVSEAVRPADESLVYPKLGYVDDEHPGGQEASARREPSREKAHHCANVPTRSRLAPGRGVSVFASSRVRTVYSPEPTNPSTDCGRARRRPPGRGA